MRLRAPMVAGLTVAIAVILMLALAFPAFAGQGGPITTAGPQAMVGLQTTMPTLAGSVLWDQPSVTNPGYGWTCGKSPSYALFASDDFVNTDPWAIQSIYVPGEGGGSALLGATSLTWQIYADAGGVPDGSPIGLGNAPYWELTLSPSSSQVTVATGYWGTPSRVLLTLPSALVLPPRHWWLVFYPTWATGGTYAIPPATTSNGYLAQLSNTPSPAWQSVYMNHDIAFTLGGLPALPRVIKQEVLSELESATPHTTLWLHSSLGTAMTAVRRSLDPKFWLDDRHLVPSRGRTVFDYEGIAVSALCQAVKRGAVGPVIGEELISDLVSADWFLAKQIIDDAIANDGLPSQIALAESKLAQGAACAATDPGAAIDAYRAAWLAAVAAF